MSDKINDGEEAAFPCYVPGHTEKFGVGGMSLRDYFAAQALPAVMNRMHEDIQSLGSSTFPSNVAHHAYKIADAMLERSA